MALKRLPVTVTPETWAALLTARGEDGLPATARVRALLHLWRTDQAVRERADTLAKTMR